MHVKIEMRLLSIVLCVLFLLAGCGNGRGIPFEQLCDVNTGQIPAVSGLQPSGEKDTETAIYTDYQSFQAAYDMLVQSGQLKLPTVEEKTFENHAVLLLVHKVPQKKDYAYRIDRISSDQGILSVQAELAQDPERFGGDIECHRIVLVQLDRQDVQDVQEVAVTTKPVHRTSSN